MSESLQNNKSRHIKALDLESIRNLQNANRKPSDLDDEFLNKIQRRKEQTVWHYVRVLTIGVLGAIGIVVLVVYFWHIVMPENCRWLNRDDLDTIRTLFISIIASYLISYSLHWFTNQGK